MYVLHEKLLFALLYHIECTVGAHMNNRRFFVLHDENVNRHVWHPFKVMWLPGTAQCLNTMAHAAIHALVV